MSYDTLLEYTYENTKKRGSNPEENQFLYAMLRMTQPRRVLEVGVSHGHMTVWLAQALKENGKGKLISVDNWSKAHGGEAHSPKAVHTRLDNCELRPWVEVVSSDSQAFMSKQGDDTFDFVWIDGDHSYEGALADLKEGKRISRRWLAAHDTAQTYDGVRKACEEIGGGYFINCFRGVWVCDLGGSDE